MKYIPRTGVFVAAIFISGCAAGYRVGVGPTVDTRGQVGVNLTHGGYFGGGTRDGLGFVPVAEVEAGAAFNPAGPAIGYAVGWDVMQTQDDEVALRAGVRLHGRWVFLDVDGQVARPSVEAVAAGSFGPLRRYHLSAEFRAGVGADASFRDPFNTFALNLVYDRLTTWHPLDDF